MKDGGELGMKTFTSRNCCVSIFRKAYVNLMGLVTILRKAAHQLSVSASEQLRSQTILESIKHLT